MKNIKQIIVSGAFILCSFTTNSWASGIPTVDLSAIAQAVEQLQQLRLLYSQAQSQFNQAVSTYNNFVGTRGMGLLHYDQTLRQFLPSNFESQIRSVMNGGFASLSSEGKSVWNSLNLGKNCLNEPNTQEKARCEKEQAVFAEKKAQLKKGQETVNKRLENVEKLMQQINSAQDAKAIADLSARIQAEQAALAAGQIAAAQQQKVMDEEIAFKEKQEDREIVNTAMKAHTPEEIRAILKGEKP